MSRSKTLSRTRGEEDQGTRSRTWSAEQQAVAPPLHHPEKAGWLRRFCGRGLFRELWRSRFVSLRGEHLLLSDQEVGSEVGAQRGSGERVHLLLYDRSEETRSSRRRSKKDLSRFSLIGCPTAGPTVPHLVFLAVSPEEKDSWINHLNAAILRAKSHMLDQIQVEEQVVLLHPTRDRVRIPPIRRLPSRGHLLTVSSSQGMLTLDLVEEEELHPGGSEVKGRQRSGTDASQLRPSPRGPATGSLPRGSERCWGRPRPEAPQTSRTIRPPHTQQVQSLTPQPGKRLSAQGRRRCSSMDQGLSSRPARIHFEFRAQGGGQGGGQGEGQGGGPLQSLIAQKMQRAQELLEELRLQELQEAGLGGGAPPLRKDIHSPRLRLLHRGPSPSRSPRSRSSDSIGLRGKEAHSRRGKESPRSKAQTRPSPPPTSSPRLPSSSYSPDTPVLAQQSPSSPPPRNSEESPPPPLLLDSHPPPRLSEESATASFSPEALKTSCTSSPLTPPSPPAEEVQEEEQREEQEEEKPEQRGEEEEEQREEEEREEERQREEEEEVACRRAEAVRLLEEAVCSWKEAQEVLEEVKELQSLTLRRRRRTADEKTPRSPAATAAPPQGDALQGEDRPASGVDEDQSETS